MSENQKLREALQAIAEWDSHDVMLGVDFGSNGVRDFYRRLARQALALPTAEQVDDINVAESFTSVTKTAAPVGERLTLSAEDVHAAFVKHFPKTRISQAWIGFAAEIAEAVAARAALSAGDAVDAQRYRWLREQNDDDFSFAVVKNPHFDVYESPEELDAAIDNAIRARKDNT